MTVKRITVETASHPYPIYVCANALEQDWSQLFSAKDVIVITQANLLQSHPDFLKHLFGLDTIPVVLLPDGEKYKTLQTWQWLMDELLTLKCHRDTLLVAWGGGIVGDIVGFAAATFYRGISFIQMPTTLIAQVDSAVGGKTGVNHQQVKNAIGAFYQPQAVLIDTVMLRSLPEREFIAGLAEVIKYALIADETFLRWLEVNIAAIRARDEQALLYMIEQCVRLKALIVSQDENEKNGKRFILNFGHTFGHALEAYYHYENILHGEAVAIGMRLAVNLSQQCFGLDGASVLRVKNLLRQAGLLYPHVHLPPPATWLDLMAGDKKHSGEKQRFILLSSLGCAAVAEDVLLEDLKSVISASKYS